MLLRVPGEVPFKSPVCSLASFSSVGQGKPTAVAYFFCTKDSSTSNKYSAFFLINSLC